MGDQSVDSIGLDSRGLVAGGVLTAQALEFLEACLHARLNVAISGPAESGKRALLHSLIPYLDLDGQILLVQNPGEPSLIHRGITSVRARPQAEDGHPGITRPYLLTLVPKMHPTALIIDRVEGAEVVPLLQLLLAMDGILFTVVAESPTEALVKLEDLARMHGAEAQPGVTRRILSTALHLIVQLGNPQCGSSAAISLTEIVQAEQGAYVLRDIFGRRHAGVLSANTAHLGRYLQPTGLRPIFLHRLETLGVPLGDHVFSQR